MQQNQNGQEIKVTPSYVVKNLKYFKSISCDKLNIHVFLKNESIDDYEHLKKKGFIHKGLTIGLDKKFLVTDVIYKSVKYVTFSYSFNESLPIGFFPSGVESIVFKDSYNQSLKKGVLPEGLKELTLGSSFSLEIRKGELPNSLEKLVFDRSPFSNPIDNTIYPPNLKYLEVSSQFKQVFNEKTLPPKLSVLIANSRFNNLFIKWTDAINFDSYNFGSTVTILDLGCANISCTDYRWLPKNLLKLKLPGSFNIALYPNIFPESITSLSLGRFYNTPMTKGCLPPFLKTLKIFAHYNKSLIGILPETLESLVLPFEFLHTYETVKPCIKLTKLTIVSNNRYPIGRFIPKTVTKLILDGRVNIERSMIPHSVKILKLTNPNVVRDNAIPSSVTDLNVEMWPINSELVIPRGVKILKFSPMHLKKGVIPDTAEHVTITSKKCEYEKDCFPPSVRSLVLYNTPDNLGYNLIPTTVKHLRMTYSPYYNYIDPTALHKDIIIDVQAGYSKSPSLFSESQVVKLDGVLTNKLK